MSTAELLARLDCKTSDPAALPGGGGPRLSPSDIAAALGMAKVPEGARYLAHVKHAGQAAYAPDVAVRLYMALAEDAEFRVQVRKPSHRPGLVLDLCKMAVREYCTSPVCPRCHGIGYEPDRGFRRCGRCHGFRVVPGDRQEAIRRSLPISPRTFNRHWRRFYGAGLDTLARWDGAVIAATGWRLR